jgi:multiple sugar transport system permease protein
MKWLGKIAFSIAVLALLAFWLLPMLWQVLTAFKTAADITAIPPIYWPQQLTLDNLRALFERRPMLRYLLNSAVVSISGTLLCLVVATPAAYALSRLRPRFARAFVVLIWVLSLCPFILVFLGLLELVQHFHLVNNYLALIVPYAGFNLPVTLLVLRSFFDQLPTDLEDAARIDGYALRDILLKLLVPLALPAVVTVGLLDFIFCWNEFLLALAFITRDSLRTVAVAATQIDAGSAFEIPYGPLAAATLIGTLPLAVLILLFQRKIVSGLTAGAIKG